MPYVKEFRAMCVAGLLAMAGCTHTAGRDFARPEQMGVLLGQSTEADIVGRYGPPASRTTVERSGAPVPATPPGPFDAAPVPGTLTVLRYAFVMTEAPINGGDINQKVAVFSFWNGTLVAEDFTSSFAADSSDFDEDSARFALESHQMTRDAVIARFGPPGGRFIYPMTSAPGLERLHYSYLKFDQTTHQRQVKTMDVVFDASGHMLDYRAARAANPFTLPAASGSGGGMMFVPVGRVGGHR